MIRELATRGLSSVSREILVGSKSMDSTETIEAVLEPTGETTVKNKECRFGARRVSAGKTPGGNGSERKGAMLYKRETQLALGTCTRTKDCIYLYKRETMDCKHRELCKIKVTRCSPQLALGTCTRTEVATMKLRRYK